MVFTISPRVSVPLSTLMIIFALFIPGTKFFVPHLLNVKSSPIFTNWRDEKGEIFLMHRLEKAPIHYGLLHIVPAIIWSLLMPLQYWDNLRKSRPAFHRFCGYVIFSCSLVLAISGALFIPRHLSWSNPAFTMHRVFGIPILPSFDTYLLIFASPTLFLTLCRALYFARQKRFADHRRWAVLHGISGYIISLQRAWMLIVNGFATLVAEVPFAQKTLGINKTYDLVTRSHAELAAFAFTTWAAGITGAVWAIYLYRQNALPKVQKSKTL